MASRPGEEPYTLVPRIEDILRTSYCTPGSIFLVEGVESIPVSRTKRWQAIRLLLGDGALCAQGLLDGAMHRFVETGEVGVGCYVRVDQFRLKTQPLLDEARSMVYLVLEDLITVGWNASYREAYRQPLHAGEPITEDAQELDQEEASLEYGQQHADAMQAAEAGHGVIDDTADDGGYNDLDDDDFEAFEALTFPPKKPQAPTSPAPRTHTEAPSASKPPLPIALPRHWHDPQSPLKLTTLHSIPHLPYAQNWSVNVLAVVASLSPVEASHLPPYRQRTARLADPSTAKRVHLTVFLDPEGFTPAVESAVLLVGVKNHRFDGGSLKKYASDGVDGGGGGRWWFEDPWELGWCDVGGIKRWWSEVQSSLG